MAGRTISPTVLLQNGPGQARRHACKGLEADYDAHVEPLSPEIGLVE
jgi:hypothetical protein